MRQDSKFALQNLLNSFSHQITTLLPALPNITWPLPQLHLIAGLMSLQELSSQRAKPLEIHRCLQQPLDSVNCSRACYADTFSMMGLSALLSRPSGALGTHLAPGTAYRRLIYMCCLQCRHYCLPTVLGFVARQFVLEWSFAFSPDGGGATLADMLF